MKGLAIELALEFGSGLRILWVWTLICIFGFGLVGLGLNDFVVIA